MNLSEELLPYTAAQKQNRLLLEGDGLDDYDDGFTRKNAGGGGGGGYMEQPSLMMRSKKPLIMEEDEEEKEAQPPPKSEFTDRQKANLAHYIYKQNQDLRSPWQKFDANMQAKAQARRNVQGMFGGESGDTLGFGKLFGQKSNWQSRAKAAREEKSVEDTGKEVDGQFKPAKGIWGAVKRFWWRFKNRGLPNHLASRSVGFRQAAIGPKMSWMQRLFGARRDPDRFANSAKGMGIKKPKAQGWADKLVDASKAGKLDAPGDAKSAFISDQPLVAKSQDQHQSAQHLNPDASIEEEEKLPQQQKLNLFQQKIGQQQLLQNMHKSDGYGVGQQNQYGDGDTVDDNSIDQDDDNDKEEGGGLFQKNPYVQDMMKQYLKEDEGSEDEDIDQGSQNEDQVENEDDEMTSSNFVQKFIVSQFSKM